jgi:hypothetical protein
MFRNPDTTGTSQLVCDQAYIYDTVYSFVRSHQSVMAILVMGTALQILLVMFLVSL